MSEVDIPAFDDTVQTLSCNNTKYNSFVQITHKSVRLISCDTLQLITEYVPSSGSNKITVGASNHSQILIALGGGNIVSLNISKNNELIESGTYVLDQEVACIDIS